MKDGTESVAVFLKKLEVLDKAGKIKIYTDEAYEVMAVVDFSGKLPQREER